MRLRELEVFYRVMTEGSVTAAAKKMNLSQPAVSATLRHYEDQLGVPLFDRMKGRLQPTIEAEILFPEIDRIFDKLQYVDRLSNELVQNRLGAVSVGVSMPLVTSLLPGAIRRYQARNASVQVFAHPLHRAELLDQIEKRELDFGIANWPVRHPFIETEILYSTSIICAAPREHPLMSKGEITAHDLHEQPIIAFGTKSLNGALISDAFAATGSVPLIKVHVSDSIAALAMAQAGIGLALILDYPRFGAMFPDLQMRPFTPAISVPVTVLLPPDRALSENAKAFLQAVRDEVGASGKQPAPAHKRSLYPSIKS